MNPLQGRGLNGRIMVNPRIRSGRFWTVRFSHFLVIIFMQLWESCFDSSLFVNLATILWFFWKKDSVRVRVWKRTVQTLTDSHWFFFKEVRWGFSVTCVLVWRLNRFFWSLAVYFHWWAGFCFFPPSSGSGSYEISFLLLLNPLALWSCWVCYQWWRTWRLNCRGSDSMMKIQWRISENRYNLHWIWAGFWFWNLGFMHLFLSFPWIWWFWSVTAKREKVKFVLLKWRAWIWFSDTVCLL